MEFVAIFDFIMQIFECIQDRRSEPERIEAVKEDMGDPKRRHYRGIVQTLREKEDLHGRELFQEARAVYGMLRDADAEDIDEMVDDAVTAARAAGRAL